MCEISDFWAIQLLYRVRLFCHIFSMATPEANLKYQQAKLYWITHANTVCTKYDKTVGSQIRQHSTNHTGSAKNVTCVYIKIYKKNSNCLSARHFLLHELRDDSCCSRNKTLGCCGPFNPTCGILAHLAASACNVPYFWVWQILWSSLFLFLVLHYVFFEFWCCCLPPLSTHCLSLSDVWQRARERGQRGRGQHVRSLDILEAVALEYAFI